MKLIRTGDVSSDAVLYKLLEERPSSANISHREMPTFDEHKRFVRNHPYHAWYLIMDKSDALGSIYLTRYDEIGIFLFKEYQGSGYAKRAIKMLMKLHQRERYFANVNPENKMSARMFERFGFTHIQNTYAFDA